MRTLVKSSSRGSAIVKILEFKGSCAEILHRVGHCDATLLPLFDDCGGLGFVYDHCQILDPYLVHFVQPTYYNYTARLLPCQFALAREKQLNQSVLAVFNDVGLNPPTRGTLNG